MLNSKYDCTLKHSEERIDLRMNFTDIKDETQDFIYKLYQGIDLSLKECTDFNEVNEVFKQENINLEDYKKVVKANILGRIKASYGEDNCVKNHEKILKIDIVNLDENKIYMNEYKSFAVEDNKNEKGKTSKTIIVIITTLIGAGIGAAIKHAILDAIIMGFIGSLAGFAIYEVYLAGDNKNFEKVLKKDRIINKRLDKNYLNTVVEKRKKKMEEKFMEYIESFERP
jgi:hypothetical protein